MIVEFIVGVLLVATVVAYVLLFNLSVELKAMQKSTHTVAYVSPGQFQDINDEAKKDLVKEPFDNIM